MRRSRARRRSYRFADERASEACAWRLALDRCIGAAVRAQCRLVDGIALRAFLDEPHFQKRDGIGGDGGVSAYAYEHEHGHRHVRVQGQGHGGLGLMSHLRALRRYALMECGHCAEVFVRLVCERQSKRHGGDGVGGGGGGEAPYGHGHGHGHGHGPSQFEL